MDTNSKRRAAWRRDEMERRRTERGRQRSQMMLERERAAQTAYMARMGERVGGEAGAAIGMGETRREYVTAQDQLRNAQAQRDLAASQGYAARTGADAQARSAEANYMGVQQRPELQKAQIAGDLEGRRIANQGSLAVAQQQGENQVRVGQLKVTEAREEADAIRRAANAQLRMQLQMQQNTPFVTDQGVVRRQKDGSFTMDAFPQPSQEQINEQKYMDASWLGRFFRDPGRAVGLDFSFGGNDKDYDD